MDNTAYGYLRVSTGEQERSGLGLDAQKEAITNWYQAVLKDSHGWGGFAQEHGDCSGSVPLGERPQGASLLSRLKKGDVIVFAKLDRGFRSIADLALTLKTWQAMGIAAHFLDLRIDTATPMGRAMIHMAAIFAELERDRGRERTRDAMAVLKAQGFNTGRPPWGFRGRNGRLYPDAEQRKLGAEIVAAIEEEGLSFVNLQWRFRQQGRKVGRACRAETIWRIYWHEKQLRTLEEEQACQSG